MYFRGKNVRIQADYVFTKVDGDLFTVRDLANDSGGALTFTRNAEQVLGSAAREGTTAYFKFYGDPNQDDFTLAIYNEDEELVDQLAVSDLRMTWQTALLLAIADVGRDSPDAIVE
jgi:hypothetical protein